MYFRRDTGLVQRDGETRKGKEDGRKEGGLESIGCLTDVSLALPALATVLLVVRGNNYLKSRFVINRSVCIVSCSFTSTRIYI